MLYLIIVSLTIVHVLLPLWVTVHVLLTKRDPAVAVGWIGVCWLMPWIGVVLYVLLGINRVRCCARKLMDDRYDIASHPPSLNPWKHEVEEAFQPLAHMLDRLTERSLVGGNQVQAVHNGDNVYPIMLEAIANAGKSVLLCAYIFRNDDLGAQFVAALKAAKERGVEVRVLVDGIGSGYFFCGIKNCLKAEGIACAQFMHSFWPWRMPFINLRNHRKILVIDGKIGFMGGLNIGSENILARPVPGFMSVSDTHFCLEGPIVQQLAEVFARDWVFTTGETLAGPRYFPGPTLSGNTPARIVTSGPDEDIEKIEYTILQALTLARRRVCFMTPYFIPDGRFATELGLAALRGVQVDIVVPRFSNYRLIDDARDACLQQLVEAGCCIWLGGSPFNHSKLMVVDDYWSFVGSANLDARSLRLNFEINVELYDTEIARSLMGFIWQHCNHALTLEEIGAWSFPVRIRNAFWRLFAPYL